MTSLYRVYAHASSPAFLAQLRNEVVSVLGASAPHAAMRANELAKVPGKTDLSAEATKIHTNENSSGLEFRATLRDVWLLCHRLRSADDVGVQVIRRGKFVHTLNDLDRALKVAPIHAFSPKLPKDSPWAQRTKNLSQKQRWNALTLKGAKRNNNLQNSKDKPHAYADNSTAEFLEDEETSLLAHNLRVILKNSRLSDHDEVRAKAIMSLEDRALAQLEKSREPQADRIDDVNSEASESIDNEEVVPNDKERENGKEPARPSMTILIDRNHLSATLSAAGHASHALHRRGFRPYTIETSLRETIAAPVVTLCQDHSTPLSSLPKEIARLPSASAQVSKLAYGKAIQNMAKFAPDIVNPLISTAKDQPKISGSANGSESQMIEQKSEKSEVDASNEMAVSSQTKSLYDKATPLVHARDRSSSSEITASIILDSLRQADPTIKVFDPFCGSGTILIESAMKFLGLPARALPRNFAFEKWPIHNQEAYQKMIDEWDHYHEQVYNTYIGFMKHNRLTTTADKNAQYDPFPKFFGSDLRMKSLYASSHNMNVAGLTPFVDLAQGDFEAIIASGYASAVDALRNDKLYEGQLGLKQLPFIQRAEDARNLLTQDRTKALTHHHDRKLFESAKIPSLAGYTMITNVPWGISDAKPRRKSDHTSPDGPRGLNFDRTYVNTTQQESMEDLYFRFGRALYQYGSMFRDVFVLSANHLFEKTTAAGASAARREETKTMRASAIRDQMLQSSTQSSNLIGSSKSSASNFVDDDDEDGFLTPKLSSTGSASSPGSEALVSNVGSQAVSRSDVLRPDPSPLAWTRIATFYNQGVKTHLLRLDR